MSGLVALGGPGSGNFGHAGRPGEVGGSASGESTKIYHNSPDLFESGKPDFDAFFGNADFVKSFPNEWGPYTYEIELPPSVRVLNLDRKSTHAREFMARVAKIAYPTDPNNDVWIARLRQGDTEAINEFYEAWTDKAFVAQVLRQMPAYDAVQFRGEFVVPKEVLSKLHGKRIRTAEMRMFGGPGSGNFGHAGRPGQIGGSASESAVLDRPVQITTPAAQMRQLPLPTSLGVAEDRIRREGNEHGYVIKGGRAIRYLGQDHQDGIRLPMEGTLGGQDDPFRGAVFTHNHPAGSGLSKDDVFAAAAHNMQEMRAVNADGTHVVRLIGDAWPDPQYLIQRANIEDAGVHQDFIQRIRNGSLTNAEANKQHWPEVWRRVSETQLGGGFRVKDIVSFSFEPKA